MQLSLFSISYAGFWGQDRLTLEQFLNRAAQLGYTDVMIAGKRPHLSPLDTTSDSLANIRETLRETKLRCSVIAGYTDFAGGPASEVPHLELQIAYVESLARIAKELGAGIVRIFTAYEALNLAFGTLWERTVRAIRECCDRSAVHGVTIAIQNHHDLALHTDALLEFLHDVDRPNCKLGFDAWSPALRGESIYEAARRAAPYTACTTNADYVRLPRYRYQPDLVNYLPAMPDAVRAVTFGTGFIHYPDFFRGLRDGGFDGVATFEMCSPLRGGGSEANLDRCATTYVNWMRDHGFADSSRGATDRPVS